MRALVEQAEALASATIKRRVDALADAWREHGVRVTTDAGSVTIEGKGLGTRRLTDLRFVGLGR